MPSAAFGGSYSGISFHVDVSESSPSQANNTSVVNMSVYLVLDSTAYRPYDLNGTSTWSVSLNGTSYSGSYNYDFRSQSAGYTISLFSTSVTVAHNTDGSKTVSYSGSTSAASPLGSASVGTNSLTLTRFYLWGQRRGASTFAYNTTAQRWDGSVWTPLVTAKRWTGSAWVNLS